MAEAAASGAPEYPASWEADVALRDGHTVRVRPIHPADAEELGAFHQRQSAESIYFRFLSPRPTLSDKELARFTQLDYEDRMAFVGVLGDKIIAVARYERYDGTDTAEVAFLVDDDHNGRGLATVMLEYLAAAARHNGLHRFSASTLPNNRKMLSVFARAGFDVSSRIEDGVVALSFAIDPTDESTAAADRRERQAEAATVQRLLRPESVAVLGSWAPGGLGAAAVEAIVWGGYRGELCMVRTGAAATGQAESDPPQGVAALDEIPRGTDLAIVAVEAERVPAIVERCADAGVGAILIHSAGFAESGPQGAALQDRVVEVARRNGVRVLGPNCLGLVNTDPDVSLHATVATGWPPSGHVAVFAESGTLAAAILDEAQRRELGVSTFVAAGNPADVGVADMLSYWTDDAASDAVLLYMRSSGLPARLVRAARAAALRKPVATLGSVFLGASDSQQALRRVEALTRQTGVISVGSLEQLFDLGRLMADQPVPAGAGVAVVGNSDGAVAMAADACAGSGLQLVDLAADGSNGGGPGNAADYQNPVNLTFKARTSDFVAALDAVAQHPEVHSVLLVHTPPRMKRSQEIADAVVAVSQRHPDVTFAATMLGAAGTPRIGDDGNSVPVYSFPEHAALALGRLARYRQWSESNREVPTGTPLGCDIDAAREVTAVALARQDRDESVQLTLEEQERLLSAFAVPIAARDVVADADAAMAAVERIGWPVAIKAHRRDRRTRTAASGVAVDLADEADLRATWERMESVLGADMHPAAVQRYIERGVDASVVLRRTPGGGTIEVGLGGPVAALDDRQFGLLPLSLHDAQSLVSSSSVGRALSDPLDRVALVGVVQRLAELMEQVEEICFIEADPVIASVDGAWVADVTVEVCPPEKSLPVRKLD